MFENALQLRDFLNTLNKEDLKNMDFVCTYSDDVPAGQLDVGVVTVDDEKSLQLVGSSYSV